MRWKLSPYQGEKNNEIHKKLLTTDLRSFSAVVVIVGGNDILSRKGTFVHGGLSYIIEGLKDLKSSLINVTNGQALLCCLFPRQLPTSPDQYKQACWSKDDYGCFNANVNLVNNRTYPDVFTLL